MDDATAFMTLADQEVSLERGLRVATVFSRKPFLNRRETCLR